MCCKGEGVDYGKLLAMKINISTFQSRTVITPLLQEIWKDTTILPLPKDISSYITYFDIFSTFIRNTSSFLFQEVKRTNLFTEDAIQDIEADLASLHRLCSAIQKELRNNYLLSRKDKRLFARMMNKNEEIWEKFDILSLKIADLNDNLLHPHIGDYLPSVETTLTQCDMSVFLNQKKESFRKN